MRAARRAGGLCPSASPGWDTGRGCASPCSRQRAKPSMIPVKFRICCSTAEPDSLSDITELHSSSSAIPIELAQLGSKKEKKSSFLSSFLPFIFFFNAADFILVSPGAKHDLGPPALPAVPIPDSAEALGGRWSPLVFLGITRGEAGMDELRERKGKQQKTREKKKKIFLKNENSASLGAVP